MEYTNSHYRRALESSSDGVKTATRVEMERLVNAIDLLGKQKPLGVPPLHLSAYENDITLPFLWQAYSDLYPLFAKHNPEHIDTLVAGYSLQPEGPTPQTREQRLSRYSKGNYLWLVKEGADTPEQERKALFWEVLQLARAQISLAAGDTIDPPAHLSKFAGFDMTSSYLEQAYWDLFPALRRLDEKAEKPNHILDGYTLTEEDIKPSKKAVETMLDHLKEREAAYQTVREESAARRAQAKMNGSKNR